MHNETDWMVVCVFTRLQGQGDDQDVDLPKTIQVSWERMMLRGSQSDSVYRVGDIVDIKANGAVQKGSVILPTTA